MRKSANGIVKGYASEHERQIPDVPPAIKKKNKEQITSHDFDASTSLHLFR